MVPSGITCAAQRGLMNPIGADFDRSFPELFISRSNSIARISELAAGTLSNVNESRKMGDHLRMAP
jgi:hypothetical protein